MPKAFAPAGRGIVAAGGATRHFALRNPWKGKRGNLILHCLFCPGGAEESASSIVKPARLLRRPGGLRRALWVWLLLC